MPLPFLVALLLGNPVEAAPSSTEESEYETRLKAAEEAFSSGNASQVLRILKIDRENERSSCLLGLSLFAEGRWPDSILFLSRCTGSPYSESAYPEAYKALKQARRRAEKAKLVRIRFSLRPESSHLKIEQSFPSTLIRGSDEIWLAFGQHELDLSAPGFVDAKYKIDIDSSISPLIPLQLDSNPGIATKNIDLGDEAGGELGSVNRSPDPSDKKFDNLMAKRYRIAPDPKISQEPKSTSRSSLPYYMLALGLMSGGSSVALQIRDHDTLAYMGYGIAFACIVGGSAILIRRPSQRVSFQILPSSRGALAYLGASF